MIDYIPSFPIVCTDPYPKRNNSLRNLSCNRFVQQLNCVYFNAFVNKLHSLSVWFYVVNTNILKVRHTVGSEKDVDIGHYPITSTDMCSLYWIYYTRMAPLVTATAIVWYVHITQVGVGSWCSLTDLQCTWYVKSHQTDNACMCVWGVPMQSI